MKEFLELYVYKLYFSYSVYCYQINDGAWMNSSQGLVLVCLLMVGRTCNSSSNILILGGTVKK